MHEMILCKLGEVVLKGLNRRSFEMKLMSNLRRRTARFGIPLGTVMSRLSRARQALRLLSDGEINRPSLRRLK